MIENTVSKYLKEGNDFVAKKESWYQKPEMMGHTWAGERLRELEAIVKKYNKTKLQKYIIANVIKFDSDDWHYFSNWTKKDIRQRPRRARCCSLSPTWMVK